MAIQTLNTIKKWFKTGLKPTQAQFWDTWDSFRHKCEKVPVGDIEGIIELLDSKTDESDFKTINGESILGFGDIGIGKNIQSVNGTNVDNTDPQNPYILPQTLTDVLASKNTTSLSARFEKDNIISEISPTYVNIWDTKTNEFTDIRSNRFLVGKNGDPYYTTNYSNNLIQLTHVQTNNTTNINLPLPTLTGITERTLPFSVNGEFADEKGNITVSVNKSVPTLQEVLDNNQIAVDKGIGFNSSSTSSASSFLNNLTLWISNDSVSKTAILDIEGLVLSTYAKLATYTSRGIAILDKATSSSEKLLLYPVPLDSFTKTFPISVNGKYANTYGNIETGGFDETLSIGNSTTRNMQIYAPSGSGNKQLYIDHAALSFTDYDLNKNFTYANQILFGADNTIGSSVSLSFNRTTLGAANFHFPENIPDGEYNLSVTEVFENSSINALNASYLDANYPFAKKGDTLICKNITAGALEYLKTSTGWVSRSITIVS
ncbi:hypothetical protein EV144_106251 [Flavobacterium sp. 270]|uniref:hypothetical protein n=1 Tax=Flavobacterium sp. 270 TaxID=2512114 RepID=UPI00106542DB|nr:hypothetical protein [Flavobacterium sp. 270]TDW46579.1 hypothetical protein EV144_106251 [Flavobacterium sp. 270]